MKLRPLNEYKRQRLLLRPHADGRRSMFTRFALAAAGMLLGVFVTPKQDIQASVVQGFSLNPMVSATSSSVEQRHKVELAIFSNTQSFSSTGYPLYTVIQSSRGIPLAHHVADHGIWARFSSDGRWIAVATSVTPNTRNLSIMRSDGTDKVEVPNSNVEFGEWIPNTHKFVYGAYLQSSLFVVEPGVLPKIHPLDRPDRSHIQPFRFSPNGQYAAIPVRITHDKIDYDQLIVQKLASGAQTTLIQTKTPDGLIAGPWAADSRSVFWWPGPAHSSSGAMDGLTLTQTDLSGHSEPITTTLIHVQWPQVIYRTVVPFGNGNAVLQVGGRREVFLNKQVGVWENGKLTLISGEPGKVQLSPDVTRDGRLVAFTEAPVLENYWGTEARLKSWVNQFTLSVYNMNTRQTRSVKSAGQGIQTPLFTGDGQNIIYLKGNQVQEVRLTESQTPKTLATLPDGLLQVEDFQS